MSRRDQRAAEARELSRMLVSISEQSIADFEAIADAVGLPVHLARAVVRLSEPAPMRDLADLLACDRSYITNIADQLEERGLVERVPGQDRRVKLLRLTPAGLTVRGQITDAVSERALVLRRLTDDQRRALRPLLEALLRDEGPSAS